MRNKFSTLLVSVLLAMLLVFTSVFTVACQTTDNSDSTGDSSVTDPVDPDPTPSVDDDPTVVDRSAYTVSALSEAVGDVYAKDYIAEGVIAFDSILGTYMVGDLYSQALDYLYSVINSKLGGTNLEAALNLAVVYKTDGNWYRQNTDEKVNACLNAILNAKLNGDDKPVINYDIYGDKTLAYIFFDYEAPAATGSVLDITDVDMRTYMLSQVFASNEVIYGISQMTLNEAKALLGSEASSAEKANIILTRFGGATLDDVLSLAGTSFAGENAFVETTLNITLNEVYAIMSASTRSKAMSLLAAKYDGVTLGDVYGVSEGDLGYIAEYYTIDLYDVFTAMADEADPAAALGNLYIGKVGNLTLQDVITAYIPTTETEALENFNAVAETYSELFSLTLSELVAGTDSEGTAVLEHISNVTGKFYETYKTTVVYGEITVDDIIAVLTECMQYDDSGNISGFDVAGFVTSVNTEFGSDLNTLTVYDKITVGGVFELLAKAVTTDTETGETNLDLATFLNSFYNTYYSSIDSAVAALTGLNLEALQTLFATWYSQDEDGVVTVNWSTAMYDVYGIIESKYLEPNGISVGTLTELLAPYMSAENYKACVVSALSALTGLTETEIEEAFGTALDKIAETLQTEGTDPLTEVLAFLADNYSTIYEMIVANYNELSGDANEFVSKYTAEDGTVDYYAMFADLYTANRESAVSAVKAALSNVISGTSFMGYDLGYDIVEKLFFEPIDYYLEVIKTGESYALQAVAVSYVKNYVVFANDYMTAYITVNGDKTLYTFTASDGDVFDVTLSEVNSLLTAVIKVAGGAEESVNISYALEDLVGDAKLGTIMEALASAFASMGDNGLVEQAA